MTIAWLTPADVRAACPPPVSIRRVRGLMVASDLAHRNGKRLYLLADRLEQFIEESFACRSGLRTEKPARKAAAKPARAPTTSKGRTTRGSGSTLASTLATGIWRSASLQST